jgi:hypothetical protein
VRSWSESERRGENEEEAAGRGLSFSHCVRTSSRTVIIAPISMKRERGLATRAYALPIAIGAAKTRVISKPHKFPTGSLSCHESHCDRYGARKLLRGKQACKASCCAEHSRVWLLHGHGLYVCTLDAGREHDSSHQGPVWTTRTVYDNLRKLSGLQRCRF